MEPWNLRALRPGCSRILVAVDSSRSTPPFKQTPDGGDARYICRPDSTSFG